MRVAEGTRSVIGLLTRSPSVGSVISATLLAARAWHLSPQFIHAGNASSPNASFLWDQLGAQGVAPDRLQFLGEQNVTRTLLAHIRSVKPVLIVLGARPSETAFRDLVGSTARRITLQAGASVLLVSTRGRPPTHWRSVLVDVEYTVSGGKMAAFATDLAPHLHNDPHFIFAHQEPVYAHRGEQLPPFRWSVQTRGNLSPEAFQLANFVDGVRPEGGDVEAVILRGRLGETIAAFARDVESDLLVLRAPTRALGVWSRLLSHPLMLAIAELPCSVLLYREPKMSKSGGSK